MKYYTGIGSRETPQDVQTLMTSIASALEVKGYILRSGGANGADLAFENGVTNGNKEIYLPWKGFNGSDSTKHHVGDLAMLTASKIHPNWGKCSNGAKKLHARNIYQVIGSKMDKPSHFIICWTKDAQIVGGTATAIKYALQQDIQVFNLADPEARKRLEGLVNGV